MTRQSPLLSHLALENGCSCASHTRRQGGTVSSLSPGTAPTVFSLMTNQMSQHRWCTTIKIDQFRCRDQSRVTSWLSGLPPGYYWYGRKHSSSGRPPRWVDAAFQVPVTDSDPLSSSADDIHCDSHNSPVTLEPDVPVT